MIKIGSFLFWEERTGEERIAFEASNGYVVKLWEMFDEEAGLLDGEKVFETDESSTGWMYTHREGQVEADLETGVWKLDLDESAWNARVYEGMETGGFIEEGDDRRGSDEGGREPAARAALAALAGRSAPPPPWPWLSERRLKRSTESAPYWPEGRRGTAAPSTCCPCRRETPGSRAGTPTRS